MKRYHITPGVRDTYDGETIRSVESPFGEWVLYEDAERELHQLRRALVASQQRIRELETRATAQRAGSQHRLSIPDGC